MQIFPFFFFLTVLHIFPNTLFDSSFPCWLISLVTCSNYFLSVTIFKNTNILFQNNLIVLLALLLDCVFPLPAFSWKLALSLIFPNFLSYPCPLFTEVACYLLSVPPAASWSFLVFPVLFRENDHSEDLKGRQRINRTQNHYHDL